MHKRCHHSRIALHGARVMRAHALRHYAKSRCFVDELRYHDLQRTTAALHRVARDHVVAFIVIATRRRANAARAYTVR